MWAVRLTVFNNGLSARRFEKCFNCLGEHRVKRCEKSIDVSEDVREFVEEIIMGDSSGDEKVDPEDMSADEKLGTV